MESSAVPRVAILHREKVAIRDILTSPRLRVNGGFSDTDRSTCEHFHRLRRRNRAPIREDVVTAIENVGAHSGCALILENAIFLPFSWGTGRRSLTRNSEHNRYATQAGLTVMAYLGAAGYRSLSEYFDDKPHFWVHAKGREIGGVAYSACPHKLPHEVATVHPHKPFGPALFGDSAQRLDAISPDISAYVVMDKSDDRTEVGPYLYCLDEILASLDDQTTKLLMDKTYRITPDVAVTRSSEVGFGGVTQISVVGKRGSESHPDGRSYFRYVDLRTEDALGRKLAIERLRICLDDIEKKGGRLNLSRGDVLLVNNRRTATRWDSKSLKGGVVRGRKDTDLAPSSRTILRMSFYSPAEIPPKTDLSVQ